MMCCYNRKKQKGLGTSEGQRQRIVWGDNTIFRCNLQRRAQFSSLFELIHYCSFHSAPSPSSVFNHTFYNILFPLFKIVLKSCVWLVLVSL